jgi:UDP-glucose 4-epimerase
MMNILVTGGAGYIGSHTCVELLQAGHAVTIVDNLINSKMEAVRRIQDLAGKGLTFHLLDLLDRSALNEVFRNEVFSAVIHFAGLKSPGASVQQPLSYYSNNITGTITLCEVMAEHGVKDLVFSSSATVYGDSSRVPVREEFPCHQQANPYGRTKRMIEVILEDIHTADPEWNIALLRYFNPVGAHPSGMIGEDPQGIPNNLMPVISQVAVGSLPELKVFGGDYPTPDGTGIRDYVHVVDVASGHLKALDRLREKPGLVTYNLGTNRGYSVLELVGAFEKVSNKKIPYRIVDRRPGDVAISFADVSKAKNELRWCAARSIEDMCADAWRWQARNPHGYEIS